MDIMYAGIWQAGIRQLRTTSEWILFLFLVGCILGLGYLCGTWVGNPLRFVPINRLLILVLLLVGLGMVSSKMQGLRETPYNIVSFELAKTQETATKIIETWKAFPLNDKDITASEQARNELFLDFIFITIYVLGFGLFCFGFAEKYPTGLLASLSLTLGWSALFAGILDVVENLALLKMLGDKATPFLAGLAFWCALPKLFVTLVLIVPCILLILLPVFLWRVWH